MEPSGKDGRGGEVSLAAPGHMRAARQAKLADAAMAGTHQRPSYRLAHKSLCTRSRRETRAPSRRRRRRDTCAPRDKQNSRMPRWQARTSGRPIASPIRACVPVHAGKHVPGRPSPIRACVPVHAGKHARPVGDAVRQLHMPRRFDGHRLPPGSRRV